MEKCLRFSRNTSFSWNVFFGGRGTTKKLTIPLLLIDSTLARCFFFYLVSRPPPTLPALLPSQLHLNTYHWLGCPAAATTYKNADAQATWRVLSKPSTNASLLTRARLRRWPPLTWTALKVSIDDFFFHVDQVECLQSLKAALYHCVCVCVFVALLLIKVETIIIVLY